MKKLILLSLLILPLPMMVLATIEIGSPIGWASVNANGQDGTTGGAGGTVVTVTTMAELITQSNRVEPLIIQIDGLITITPKGQYIDVRSNKTIVGITPGSGIAEGGFRVRHDRNIIFKNLIISDTFVQGDWAGDTQDWDGIQIRGTGHHIWIDHCAFLRQGDGAVDISHGANYITVSNSLFAQNNKTSLVSNSDTDTFTDRYKVTMHHNWFNETTQRHPRVRFGQVHLFNNYYSNMGGYGRQMGFSSSHGYGIGVGVNAQIYSEHNFFESVSFPTSFLDNATNPGFIIDIGSHFVHSGTMHTRPAGINWNPANHYQYTLDAADMVKVIVTGTAGARLVPTTSKPVASLQTGTIGMHIYPNPITNTAKIVFDIPVSAVITVILRDMTGRALRVIANSHFSQGSHTIDFDRNNLRAGIYLITLESANQTLTRRIVIN